MGLLDASAEELLVAFSRLYIKVSSLYLNLSHKAHKSQILRDRVW